MASGNTAATPVVETDSARRSTTHEFARVAVVSMPIAGECSPLFPRNGTYMPDKLVKQVNPPSGSVSPLSGIPPARGERTQRAERQALSCGVVLHNCYIASCLVHVLYLQHGIICTFCSCSARPTRRLVARPCVEPASAATVRPATTSTAVSFVVTLLFNKSITLQRGEPPERE